MARHRWATGEQTSGPDPLHRVVQLDRGKFEPGGAPDWAEAGGEDYPAADPAAGLNDAEHHRSRRRWVATRRAALMAAGCALAIGGWQFLTAGPGSTEVVPIGPPASPRVEAAAGADPTGKAAAPAEARPATPAAGKGADDVNAGTVIVHIAGAVQKPGVVEAPAGSRVFEVLHEAGGPLPHAELSAVNLAAVVRDGQQILIPRVGDPLPPVGSGTDQPPGATGALIDLNTAGVGQLEELPRVGPVLAERIVEWRSQHGPFTRPEDLDAVPGIGPAMLESLLPLVSV